MSFADIVAQHRRLSILRLLAEAPENSLNDAILHTALGELGLASSRDQVKGDLAWLAEQGLLSTEAVGHLAVATLTPRGDDVAAGRATHPGVKRPSPRG
jgi:hypothetical protein